MPGCSGSSNSKCQAGAAFKIRNTKLDRLSKFEILGWSGNLNSKCQAGATFEIWNARLEITGVKQSGFEASRSSKTLCRNFRSCLFICSVSSTKLGGEPGRAFMAAIFCSLQQNKRSEYLLSQLWFLFRVVKRQRSEIISSLYQKMAGGQNWIGAFCLLLTELILFGLGPNQV